MRKWTNSREISRKFVLRNFLQIFANTKNLTKFDSDTAFMVHAVSFFKDLTLHFGGIKRTHSTVCVVKLEFSCH
jgi:hypothetical protein